MTHPARRAFHPRALTEKERSFAHWLIEHADVSEEEKKKYLRQLGEATVVRMCECGCASIDFAIADVPSEQFAPLVPFGDFIAKDKSVGVFVFSKQDDLAGVEIYNLAAEETSVEFPLPERLELAIWKEVDQPPEPTRIVRGPS